MTVLIPSPAASGFSDYAALKAAVEEVLGRELVTAAHPMLVGDLNSRLRVREMLTNATVSSGGLPDDFLEPATVKVDYRTYLPVSDARPGYGTYSVQNGLLILTPDADTAEMRYYSRLRVLDDADSGPVMSAYPEVYLYGLLWHHTQLVRDESGATWGQAYENAIGSAHRADAASRMGTESMSPVPRVVV